MPQLMGRTNRGLIEWALALQQWGALAEADKAAIVRYLTRLSEGT